MFYNQTFLRGFYHIFGILNIFNNFCTSESICCYFLVICKSVYRLTIQFACGGLIAESLRETLTSTSAFPALKCFDTSLASQELYLSERKDLAALFTFESNGWNFFVKLRGTMTIYFEFSAQNFIILSLSCSLNVSIITSDICRLR